MSSNHEETIVSESSPLLDSSQTQNSKRPTTERTHSLLDSVHIPQTHSPKVVVYMIGLTIFTVMAGEFLLMVPQVRIMEDIICRHYYDSIQGEGHIGLLEGVPEKLCKGPEVQSELAFITGMQSLLDCVPGVLLALPYGILADKWGRKSVFLIGVAGAMLGTIYIGIVCWFWTIFPIRAVLFGSAFLVIGGGSSVIQNMLFALISDVSTDATRSNNFFTAGAGTLLAEVFAPGVSAWLMRDSPWIPFCTGVVVMILGSCIILFIPETLRMHPDHDHITEDLPSASRSTSPRPHLSQPNSSIIAQLTTYVRNKAAELHQATKILHSVPIILLLFTFVVHALFNTLVPFYPRYFSRRLGWDLSETNFLLSYRAIINLILLLAVLPGLSYLMTYQRPVSLSQPRWYAKFQLGLSTRQKDLYLARASLVFLVCGAFLVAASPTLTASVVAITIWTLGLGFSSLCRSLVTTFVDQRHVGRLYAIISLIETLGMLSSGPVIAALYSLGLRMVARGRGDIWLGLPFLAAGFSCIVFGFSIYFVRLPKEEVEIETDE